MTDDRFSRWPLYSGLVVLAIWCFMFYWPVTQIAFSILFMLWAVPFASVILCLLGVVMWCAVASIFQRRWRRSISMLAFPLLLVAAMPASLATDRITSWLTFIANKSRYMADAEAAAKQGKRTLSYDWGGNVMIGVNRAVVWDAADEVSADKDSRVILRFGNHFYLVEW